VFPGRREQLRVCGHSPVWVRAEEEGSRCGGCWVEQPGLLEEDGAASWGRAVTGQRLEKEETEGRGEDRSLFLEEKTMERKKKGGCGVDGLPSLLVFGR